MIYMEKLNFVRDGGSKLPPGFRFEPTDEESVFQYLVPKIFSSPLPATVIPEIHNLFTFHPSHLPGESEQDRYYFIDKGSWNNRNVKRSMRATCDGYWRVLGFDKLIISRSKRMPIVGIKKTLVFYKANRCSAARTNWFMHLYCIAVPRNTSCNTQQRKHSSQGCLVEIGKWDLCHIYLKKRRCNKVDQVYDNGRRLRNYDDLLTGDESDKDSSCASSDSDSSVVSEVSSSSANSDTNSSSC